MKHSEFRIGTGFLCGDRRWRCTDIGTRLIVAIRVDEITVAGSSEGIVTNRVLSGAEAEAEGWFSGPPYPVAEMVFDEDDQEVCELP